MDLDSVNHNLSSDFSDTSPYSNLLCVSGYADSNGLCGQGLKSSNKGKVCFTDSDCPTNDATVNAPCKCGVNSNGTRYCDIMPGDSEWVNARAAVPFSNYNLKN